MWHCYCFGKVLGSINYYYKQVLQTVKLAYSFYLIYLFIKFSPNNNIIK